MEDEKKIYCGFPPLCGDNPQILILGTFPSTLSREKGEYYGNSRNQFWRIIYSIFDTPHIEYNNEHSNNYSYEQNYEQNYKYSYEHSYEHNYGQRKTFLFNNGIAVWDVIAQCEVDGALDSAIRNPIYNMALPKFIEENDISKVYFNGNNAYAFYKRGIGHIEKNVLPSTSPAYAAMSFDKKRKLWHNALNRENSIPGP